MNTKTVQNSIPLYKTELLNQLRDRLGDQVTNRIADRSGFSDRYIRDWFKNSRKQDQIWSAAKELLAELKSEEDQKHKELAE